jgi:hypothetical protein
MVWNLIDWKNKTGPDGCETSGAVVISATRIARVRRTKITHMSSSIVHGAAGAAARSAPTAVFVPRRLSRQECAWSEAAKLSCAALGALEAPKTPLDSTKGEGVWPPKSEAASSNAGSDISLFDPT